MTESFLRPEDLINPNAVPELPISDDESYTPDFGLESRNTTGERIDIDRIIIKPQGVEKPYPNKRLKEIASSLFGIQKTVVEKTSYVGFLTTEKSLAVIERDNHLRSLALNESDED
jgi:hypothetical protein